MFKLKDEVSWKSQSAGSWTEKIGRVVAVVPAGERVKNHIPDGVDASIEFDGGLARKHESYLVLVDRGPTRKPFLYWPVVSQLRPVARAQGSGPTQTVTVQIKGQDVSFQVPGDLPGIDYPMTGLGLLHRARSAQKDIVAKGQELLDEIDDAITAELRSEDMRRMKVPVGDGKTIVYELRSTSEKLVVRSEKAKKAKAAA